MPTQRVQFVTFAIATSLALPLAGTAHAFGGIPAVPQAISQHLEQERLQQQVEQRERDAAQAERQHAAVVAPTPVAEKQPGDTVKPTAKKGAKSAKPKHKA